MRHELSVDIQVIFAGRDTQRGNINGHVKDTEESQSEHGRECISKGCPIYRREILLRISFRFQVASLNSLP